MINGKRLFIAVSIGLCALILSAIYGQASQQQQVKSSSSSSIKNIIKRSVKDSDHHDGHGMMHSHMARKVFDRACAANKDTIDDIIECLHNNEHLMKAIKSDIAGSCYKESFGLEFDPKETEKHKNIICNNRDKFETMTSCAYRKTAESVDTKEIEKLTESMVDVGLCIVNALDS